MLAGWATTSCCSSAAAIPASRSASRPRRSATSRSSGWPRRYGLADLHSLAAHGRWLRTSRSSAAASSAASRSTPTSRTARTPTTPRTARACWWRRARTTRSPTPTGCAPTSIITSCGQAVAAGVDYREATEIEASAFETGECRLRGRSGGKPFSESVADFVIDASGPARFLARPPRHPLGTPDGFAPDPRCCSVTFEGVREFEQVAPEGGAVIPRGPTPTIRRRSIICCGRGGCTCWRFDHGVTSAGFLLAPDGMAGIDPEWAAAHPDAAWRRLLRRYPSIEEQFAGADALFPVRFHPMIQHRMAAAAGARLGRTPPYLRLHRSALFHRHRLEPPGGRATRPGIRIHPAAGPPSGQGDPRSVPGAAGGGSRPDRPAGVWRVPVPRRFRALHRARPALFCHGEFRGSEPADWGGDRSRLAGLPRRR